MYVREKDNKREFGFRILEWEKIEDRYCSLIIKLINLRRRLLTIYFHCSVHVSWVTTPQIIVGLKSY